MEGLDAPAGVTGIETCSKVGIMYEQATSAIANKCRSQVGYSYDYCKTFAWRLSVPGNPCGVPIQDRDVVSMVSEVYDRSMLSHAVMRNSYVQWDSSGKDKSPTIPELVIFRSDYDEEEYFLDFPCQYVKS